MALHRLTGWLWPKETLSISQPRGTQPRGGMLAPEKQGITCDWSDLLEEGNQARARTSDESQLIQVQQVPELDSVIRQPHHVKVVESILAPSECQSLIESCNEVGFGETSLPHSYRGNLRLQTYDNSLAEALWLRLEPLFREESFDLDGSTWEPIGLNERVRYSKYRPGDAFQAHLDGHFVRNLNERSFYTINLYLNDNFELGRTRVFKKGIDNMPVWQLKGKPGSALIFAQTPLEYLLHDGEVVEGSFKYLLRTDVVFRRTIPIKVVNIKSCMQ